MNEASRPCQNCQTVFRIEPDDVRFYQKIKVPPPTFCPSCRFQRRIAFRNERNWYRRSCDLCKKDVISIYSTDKPFPVYCHTCYLSDQWDPTSYGVAYDFTKPFFAQFQELSRLVPRQAIYESKSENAEYTNYSAENKNCYLLVSALQSEDCAYGDRVFNSRDCYDNLYLMKCERCYECIHVDGCSRSAWCQYSEQLIDCLMCFDCRGLISCFGCVGLRNRAHHWLNQPMSKEAYEEKLKKVLADPQFFEQERQKYEQLRGLYPRKYARITRSEDATGDNIFACKRCTNCFYVNNVMDAKNVFTARNDKDLLDISVCDNAELGYEVMSGEQNYDFKFTTTCWYNQFIQYADGCMDCANVFGCVSLRKKSYCILNQQYTKEDYEALTPRIIEQMQSMPYRDRTGREYRYGEFFPSELSPFCYNESVAHQYFPLTREQALEKGFGWKDPEARQYTITMPAEEIPWRAGDVPDTLVNEVFGCAHGGTCEDQCTTAFRIIKPELKFYRDMNLPLPKLCPNCRHHARRKERNPVQLWDRGCMCAGARDEKTVYTNTGEHFHDGKHCPSEFKTTYAPERSEIIYCEPCYQVEMA